MNNDENRREVGMLKLMRDEVKASTEGDKGLHV